MGKSPPIIVWLPNWGAWKKCPLWGRPNVGENRPPDQGMRADNRVGNASQIGRLPHNTVLARDKYVYLRGRTNSELR